MEEGRAATERSRCPRPAIRSRANSIYGKLPQGARERKVYNARTGQRERVPQSRITCPYLAAYVTGFVRAVVSELIARLPRHRTVVSVTTDAILTDAQIRDLHLDGAACRAFADQRERLTGRRDMLETKCQVKQLLPWKTRGVATLSPSVAGSSWPGEV